MLAGQSRACEGPPVDQDTGLGASGVRAFTAVYLWIRVRRAWRFLLVKSSGGLPV